MSTLLIVITVLSGGTWHEAYAWQSRPQTHSACRDRNAAIRARVLPNPKLRVLIWCQPEPLKA